MGEDPRKKWGPKVMAPARRKLGMSQKQLAVRAGTTQNNVSLLESGAIIHSAALPRICRVLKIVMPGEYANEQQRKWAELGQRLEGKSAEQFRRALALVESMIGDEPAPEEHPPVAKRRGRARAVGGASVAVGSEPARASDETPAEAALRRKHGG